MIPVRSRIQPASLGDGRLPRGSGIPRKPASQDPGSSCCSHHTLSAACTLRTAGSDPGSSHGFRSRILAPPRLLFRGHRLCMPQLRSQILPGPPPNQCLARSSWISWISWILRQAGRDPTNPDPIVADTTSPGVSTSTCLSLPHFLHVSNPIGISANLADGRPCIFLRGLRLHAKVSRSQGDR